MFLPVLSLLLALSFTGLAIKSYFRESGDDAELGLVFFLYLASSFFLAARATYLAWLHGLRFWPRFVYFCTAPLQFGAAILLRGVGSAVKLVRTLLPLAFLAGILWMAGLALVDGCQ